MCFRVRIAQRSVGGASVYSENITMSYNTKKVSKIALITKILGCLILVQWFLYTLEYVAICYGLNCMLSLGKPNKIVCPLAVFRYIS